MVFSKDFEYIRCLKENISFFSVECFLIGLLYAESKFQTLKF